MKAIVPYVYKVTFIPDERVYIGSRFNKGGCHPNEFWADGGYFTSSKYVKALINDYGTGHDVWIIEILEVFDGPIELREVPRIENQYILQHVEALGAAKVLNRRWVVDGKEVYSNAGMTYKCQGISDKMKGHVMAKTTDGDVVKVSKQEFEARTDLVGLGEGMKFYHNPETNHRIRIGSDETPPVGYQAGLGKTCSDAQKAAVSERQKGKTFINNGEINKQVSKGEPIPEGWVEGRLKYDMPGWTPERRAKMEETLQRKADKRAALKALEPVVEKVRKVPRKRTPEEIAHNIQRQKEEHQKRQDMNVPHKNKGRKRTQESIDKQAETRAKNKQLKEAS